jgi:uncharacterized protein (DUF488 family)
LKFFTVGYGGRSPTGLVELLRTHGVRAVVDVRLRPDRASMGSFSLAKDPAKGIAGLIAGAGMRYESLVELGNLFIGCDDWKERYRRIAERAGDILVERLLAMGLEEPAALLCAEKRDADCHRQFLAAHLRRIGHEVEPIE